MAYTPLPCFSGSTNGKCIEITALATAGTIIHTAVSGTTDFDSITIDACNTDSSARLLTIEFGGTTVPDDTMEVELPANSGWVRVVNGHRLQNSLVVRAFAAATPAIIVNGYVNRYTA